MTAKVIIARLKRFFSNKTNLILTIVLFLLVSGGAFAGYKVFNKPVDLPTQEVDLPFDPEGPYAILEPRRDGYAVNLRIYRVSSYESINYELAYQATGTTAGEEFGEGPIDRGVQGTINASNKKSEYNQEILFGTCSQGQTTSTLHCVFDKNVENGTLTLRITKPYQRGDKVKTVYKMVTTWHLQQPDVALGKIASADGHFSYTSKAAQQDLQLVGYSIVNDLTGAPKLPEGKKFTGKVYGFNLPTAKTFPQGDVKIELIDNPSQEAKIARYNESKNAWDLLDTKADGSKLTAAAEGAGIFAVLENSK